MHSNWVNQTCKAYPQPCADLSPSDVFSPELPNYLVSIMWSVLIGAVIGLQREYRFDTNRCLRQNGLLPYSSPWIRQSKRINAGMRTYTVVCLGACLFTLESQYGFAIDAPYQAIGVFGDPSRVAAQIVKGMGFLGAGAILKSNARVQGLTTAASLWVTGALGMTCGSINHPQASGQEHILALIVMCIVCFVLQVCESLITWMEHLCNREAHVTFYVRMFADIQKDDPHSAVKERIGHMRSVFTPDPKKYIKLRQDSESTATSKRQSGPDGPQHESRPNARARVPMYLRSLEIAVTNKTFKKWMGRTTQIELRCAVDVPRGMKPKTVFDLISMSNCCDNLHVQKKPFDT